MALVLVAAALLGACWALLWAVSIYWSPLFFTGLWLGAAVLMYAAGPGGHPGWRRHAALALASVPVWWWFEAVNTRVDNWEYLLTHSYNDLEYAVFASIAFSTVVPALDAASRLLLGRIAGRRAPATTAAGGRVEVGAAAPLLAVPVLAATGLAATILVFALPDMFFPLVWVGPFLILDAAVGFVRGRSLLAQAAAGRWQTLVAVALAGLLCGALWEMWNFWAAPKWIYDIPYLGYAKIFEMPILGYLGYIPFAWSVYQLIRLADLGLAHLKGWSRARSGKAVAHRATE
jgi:hypothetical protein